MALESRPLVDTRLRLVRRCRRSCSYRDFQCTPTPESILIFRDPFRGKPPPCSQASRGANRCILTFYEIAANQAVKREADRGDLTFNLPPGNATLSMSHDCATQLLKLLTDPPTTTLLGRAQCWLLVAIQPCAGTPARIEPVHAIGECEFMFSCLEFNPPPNFHERIRRYSEPIDCMGGVSGHKGK
jgi:hypothetical protein